jgi:diguanylate cyclase (GGDEF)-like protein/PAS domain S-box-containing protein
MDRSEPIRILYIEDDPGLARLVQKRLGRSGYAVDIAADGEQGIAKYEVDSYDVVFVDQTLPIYDGLQVIRILASRGPLPPMIMITGTGDEKIAVEAMKLGTSDYIVKDVEGGYLDLLPSVIEKVLQQRRAIEEKNQAGKELRESEEKYRSLVERANDGITVIQDGILKYVNPHLAQMWGGSPQEIIDTPFTEYIDPDELPTVVDRYERRMQGEDVPPKYETIIRSKDGSKVYVELSAGTITYQGKLAEVVFIRDITDRKLMEEKLRQSEGRYRTLVDNINLGINLIDANHAIVMVNAAISKGFEKSISEMIGEKCFRMFEKRNAVCPYCPGVRTLATGKPAEVETEGVLNDGSRLNVRLQTFPVFGGDGKVTGFIEISEDITERKQREEELRESEEKYRSLVEFTEDSVYLIDKNKRYIFINEKYLSRLGLPRNHVMGRNYSDFHSPKENKEFSEHIKQVFATGRFVQYEHRSRRDDRYFLRTLSPVKELDGSIKAVTVISKDITERKLAEEGLVYMATHDSLTGLPNRTLFNDRLILALAQAQRHKKHLAVMLLDLDYFKNVNDTFGHNVGDQLLIAVGNRLKGLLRKGDTVARVGGDEFLVLLSEIVRLKDAGTVAHNILEAFHNPFAFDECEFLITTSIGVVIYPTDGKDADTIMKHADIAMYRAKDKGRNTYQCYTLQLE